MGICTSYPKHTGLYKLFKNVHLSWVCARPALLTRNNHKKENVITYVFNCNVILLVHVRA
jgi:hypothetical protein